MMAHKENKYFHPQKHIAHSIKKFAGLLILMQCINKLYMSLSVLGWCCFITLRPRQNGRHFPDDIFKWIFFNENVWISINISLKFVPRGPINDIPTMVQVVACRRPGDTPLSEPMMVRLPTHICVTRPQWVSDIPGNKWHGNIIKIRIPKYLIAELWYSLIPFCVLMWFRIHARIRNTGFANFCCKRYLYPWWSSK